MLQVILILAILANGDWFSVSVTACCAHNEYYDPCPDNNPQTCSTINQEYGTDSCMPACRCKYGFARNNNGDCVPESYCSKCTQPYEVYECPDCSPQTCDTRDQQYDCTTPSPDDETSCNYVCRCQQGYYRNAIGQCISAEDCGKCTGPYEYFSCGSACDNLCNSTYGQDNCNIQNIQCNSMCYCEEDYARATNGTCIPKEDCQYECPVNEQYSSCPDNLCIAKECSDAGYPLSCKGDSFNGQCPGTPGCICEANYLRDSSGTCVPTTECPSCGGDYNATAGCGINCGRLCSNYDSSEPVACTTVCNTNGCDCRSGYVYDSNVDKCVLPQDCTPVCKQNEVFSECTNCGSENRYCSDLNNCDGEGNVDENCQCQYGCICVDGYLRNTKGECVLIDDCDNCPQYEEYNQCPSDDCVPRTCSEAGYALNCTTRNEGDPCPVSPGCVCKYGYLRDNNGICIRSSSCPSCGGDANASPGCGTNCGRLCSNYNSSEPVSCPLICNTNGCDCRQGYVYDSNTYQCVLPENCTPVCQEDETYSSCINGGCQSEYCSDLNEPNSVCRNPEVCQEGCLCANGYLRNKDGVCVPIDQCDNCPTNEEYSSCPAAVCEPQTCSQAGFPLNCPSDTDPCPVNPGCICKSGYLRDSSGNCIPSSDCPSCGGDNNATLGCGVNCGNLCSNYNSDEPVICPRICYPNSCDCRSGYVYDSNTLMCVSTEDCTPVCGDYEVYTSCVEGGCDKKYCSDLSQPDSCQCPDKCSPGCVCASGYLRNSTGSCIPTKQCNLNPYPNPY